MSDSIATYIESADLASPIGLAEDVQELPNLSATGGDVSAVVDSSVYTFSKNLPGPAHQTAGYWLLFAQRAASAIADPEDAEAWSDAYRDVLENTGWVRMAEDTGWNKEEAVGAEVHEKILPIVAAILGPASTALALVTIALNTLNDMDKKSPWITLFDRRAREAKQVGFQVGFADTHRDGGVALTGAEYRIEASRTITQVLWFKFTHQDGGMYYRHLGMWLPQDVLDTHAPAIKARVADQIADSIGAIPTAP